MGGSREDDESKIQAEPDNIESFDPSNFDPSKLPPLPSVPEKPTARDMFEVFSLLHSNPQAWQEIMAASKNDSSDDNFLYFEKVAGLVAMLKDGQTSDEQIKAAFNQLWDIHIASDSSSFMQSADEKPINISAPNREQLTELFKMVKGNDTLDRKKLQEGLLLSLQHGNDQRTILDYMYNGQNGTINDPTMRGLIAEGFRAVRTGAPPQFTLPQTDNLKQSQTKGAVQEPSPPKTDLQSAIDLHKAYSEQKKVSKQSREEAAGKFRDILINDKYSNEDKVNACKFLREHHMFTRDAKLGPILKVTEQLLKNKGVDYKVPSAGEKFFNKISAAAIDLTRGAKKITDKLTDKNPEVERKNDGMRRR